jgi:DNA methylase
MTPTPEPGVPLPLLVWLTAQATSRWQRQGRYLAASGAHPAKMLPTIARTAISAYTSPGELVLDPMCGIGTTLVEAVHLDRPAVGIELEPRWADLAEANLALALSAGGGWSPGRWTRRAGAGACRGRPVRLSGSHAIYKPNAHAIRGTCVRTMYWSASPGLTSFALLRAGATESGRDRFRTCGAL